MQEQGLNVYFQVIQGLHAKKLTKILVWNGQNSIAPEAANVKLLHKEILTSVGDRFSTENNS